MPRKGDITFVPAVTSAGTSLFPFDMIPDEIKAEVEEVYATLKNHPGRMLVTFDKEEEVKEYADMVASYCAQRPEDLGGPIRFRRSPVKGQPKTVLNFRVTDLKAEEDETETPADAPENTDTAPAKKTTRANRK